MLRKKKAVGPHGGDDKTGSSKEDVEESWEMIAMDKDELELLTRKPTQEDIEANMAAGQESWVVVTDHGMGCLGVSCSHRPQSLLCVTPLLLASCLSLSTDAYSVFCFCDMLMCLW